MGYNALLLCAYFMYSLSSAEENKWDCADYYWRDYFGTIPDDAVPAGKDVYGDQQYIGLAYIQGYEYLPGTILPKQHVARTTAYGKVFTTSNQVKILCSPEKEAFEWLYVESKDLYKYLDKRLIPGGMEVGENLFIGRVYENGSYIVGKIFQHYRGNKGIWYPRGNSHGNLLSYEVLVYNCDKNGRSSIDVRSGGNETEDDVVIITY